MTTTGPSDRLSRERALSRPGTKPLDDARSSHATGGQADDSGGPDDAECAGATIQTDGGRAMRDEDATALRTYTDDEYGYSLAYPADWTVELDSGGGATFEAPRSAVGAAVFVEESRLTPAASAAAFLAELDADEYIHALELLAQRKRQLESGQTGWIVECTYAGDSHEQWRLAYLFVCAADTGYTLGIDWNAAAEFEECAAAILESFTLQAN